jgi:uncharacterized protein
MGMLVCGSYSFYMIKRLKTVFQAFPGCSFVLMTYAWSWANWLILRANPSIAPHSRLWTCFYVAGLSGPLVAAVVMSFANRGREGLRSLANQMLFPAGSPGWHAAAILGPPAIWIFSATVGLGDPGFAYSPVVILIVWTKMLVRGGPLTEEIGWRGFLLPLLLSRTNLFWASVVIFPIWGLWHLPLWFLPGVPHVDWSFALFLLLLAPVALMSSWLYVKGQGKIWLPIFFHTSINFSLNFSAVVPYANRGLWVLLGLFWVLAALLVALNRALWFARAPVHLWRTREVSQKTAHCAGGTDSKRIIYQQSLRLG